jgi:hypothetical protein
MWLLKIASFNPKLLIDTFKRTDSRSRTVGRSFHKYPDGPTFKLKFEMTIDGILLIASTRIQIRQFPPSGSNHTPDLPPPEIVGDIVSLIPLASRLIWNSDWREWKVFASNGRMHSSKTQDSAGQMSWHDWKMSFRFRHTGRLI